MSKISTLSTLSKLVGGLLASTFLATPAISQELTGTLKKIKDSGTITVGHRETSVPFSYLDEKQQPIGYSASLLMSRVMAAGQLPLMRPKPPPGNGGLQANQLPSAPLIFSASPTAR